MAQRPPASVHFGPSRALLVPDNWPPPLNVHVQFYNFTPGSLFNPAHLPSLLLPKVLTPSGNLNNWSLLDGNFFYRFQHRRYAVNLRVTYAPIVHTFFIVNVYYANSTWYYNTITDPVGNFAVDGSATVAWEDL